MVVDNNLSTISKILAYQILLVILTASGFAIVGGWHKALSPFLGGVAAFIPNLYFALRIHRSAGQEARQVVRSFYIGESGKLLLTAVLFIVIFQIPTLEILPLLFGYITVLSVFWFALLMR